MQNLFKGVVYCGDDDDMYGVDDGDDGDDDIGSDML